MKRKNIIILSLIGALCLVSYFHHTIQKYSLLETNSEFEKYEENKLAEMADEENSNHVSTKEASSSITESSSSKKQENSVKILDSKNNKVNKTIAESNKNLKNIVLNNDSMKKTNYFIEARLNTNIEREKIVSLLNEIINNEYTTEETRKTANKEKMKLIDIISKEKIIENLIKAKGFEDALIFITDHSINVIVEAEKLTDSDMAKILDIVVRETQAPLDNIKILNKF